MPKMVGMLVLAGMIWAGQTLIPNEANAYPYAYVANYHSNTVSVIDVSTNQVIGSPIPVGSNPYVVAITPDGRYAYVTNYGSNNVSVIEVATNQVIGSAIPVGSEPWGVAIT